MEVLGSHLIVLVSVIFPLTVGITYTMAVTAGHVYPFMPFMSYTGDLPLESCIFSLGLNVTTALYICICILRYNQILYYFNDENDAESASVQSLNSTSLRWGVASAIGLSVTGSFQELHAPFLHPIGALTCSYCGFVYLWYQTILSHIFMGQLNSARIAHFRSALSITSSILHFFAPFLVAYLDTSYPRNHVQTLHWTEKEEGWSLHVSCSSMEWLVFILNETYIASFYWEFKHILIRRDEIIFRQRIHSRGFS